MADRDETSRPADSSEVREEFQKLGRAISEWLEFENQYVNPGQQPAGDSMARAEIAQEARWAGEWGQQPLSLVYQIADLKLLAARDHLMALHYFSSAPEPLWHLTQLSEACSRQPGIITRKRLNKASSCYIQPYSPNRIRTSKKAFAHSYSFI